MREDVIAMISLRLCHHDNVIAVMMSLRLCHRDDVIARMPL